MTLLLAIVAIALLVAAVVVIPSVAIEESASERSWKKTIWLGLSAAAILVSLLTRWVWMDYLAMGILLIGLLVQKKKR